MTTIAYRPLALLIASLFVTPSAPSFAASLAPDALPSGGRVTAGAASVTQSANSGGARMDIKQSSDRAILDWQTFNIGAAAQVNFAQPSAASTALNRVAAGEASQIMGRLTANGQVYLVNPAGVIFGAGSRVDVGGLVASTLDIKDDDFLAGRNVFKRNGANGKVVNSGTLNAADGGLIAMLAPEVRNEGVIAARLGNVVLAAGERVTLEAGAGGRLHVAVDPATINAFVENRQMIVADGGQVVMSAQAADRLYSAVVANSGTLQARTLENRDGRILLLADMDHGEVQVGGTLDASAPSTPSPLAGEGRGEGATTNGGFVETSAAHVQVADSARVTTLAANGKNGTWLIDPNDYTIAASGGDISGATLATNLAGGNVTILSSQGATAGNGDIFVNDAVSWSANTTLSLQAARDIKINAPIRATGNTAGLTLGYGAGRDYYVNAPITLSGSNPTLKIGVGGAEDTYIVINSLGVAGDATTTTLQGMKNNLTGKYALGSDIDASATNTWNTGTGFMSIGVANEHNWDNHVPGYYSFEGRFDGLGHTVSNLFINRPSSDHVGLFGAVAYLTTIRNVGLIGGSVSGGRWWIGGLVGLNNGTISNSYNTGDVNGTFGYSDAGGLVGLNQGIIGNSYATGNVVGTTSAGGLVGFSANYFYDSKISNSYATGSVSGAGYVGGLVGDMWDWPSFTEISNSYWNTQTSGQASSPGGDGKTTAEMKQQATFSGWDFTNTWRIYEGQSTPVLRAFQSNTVTANNAAKTYDGNAWAGGNGVSYSATGSVTYAGTSQGAVNAGSYTLTPVSLNRTTQQDYQSWGDNLSYASGTLSINKAPLTVTANAASKTYDGNAYSGGAGVAYSGFVNSETASALGGTLAYSGNAQGAVNAGSYTITPSGLTSGNYTLTFSNGTLTIDPAALAVLGIGADNKNKTYGAADPALTWQLASGSLAQGDSLTGSLTRDAGENAGSYAIRQGSLTAGQNYTISYVNGVLTINKAPLTVTANAASKTYDGNAYSGGAGVAYSGFVNSESAAALGGTLAYGGNAQGAVNAGSYTITPSGLTSGNYTLSFADGALTISAAAPPVAPPVVAPPVVAPPVVAPPVVAPPVVAPPVVAPPVVSPPVVAPPVVAPPVVAPPVVAPPVVLAPTLENTGSNLPDGGLLVAMREREQRVEAPRLPPAPAPGTLAPFAALPHLEVRTDFIVLPGE